jgi:hypothetical protein
VARTENIVAGNHFGKKLSAQIISQQHQNKKNDAIFELDKFALDHLDFL